jgi:CheY-like chemotaxis protein
MPVMDGWQFLNQLKTEGRENLEQIPIVLLTAAGNKASDAAKQTQGLITKPIDLETLLSTVKKYCVSTQ